MRAIIPYVIFVVLAVGGCGGASRAAMHNTAASEAAPAVAAMTPDAPGGAVPPGATAALGGPQASAASAQPLQAAKQPLLIYTANIQLAVFEAAAGIDAVQALSHTLGGYLVRRTDTSITIRVPAETFDAAVVEVSKLGDPLHRDVSAQDVTDEFRDIETRLKNMLAVRDRLEDLLAKAKDVQEALAVERELERVTTQIEQLKGRLKMLTHLIAYSTITVTFQARPAERLDPLVELPFTWIRELGLQRLLRLR